jgi:patatin-like phospholipase/acyl hydrolase
MQPSEKPAFSRHSDGGVFAALRQARAAAEIKPYRILSIDGGGLRGLIPLVVLERLDAAKPGWRDGIHMYAGTSTGGLIALGLAKGMQPRQLLDLYTGSGKAIFDRSLWHAIKVVGKLIGPKFGSQNREKAFHDALGDDCLKDYLKDGGTGGHVCITGFDLKNSAELDPVKRNWKAKIFHNIPVSEGANDAAELAYRVAMRTSAAPTYFASYDGYVDGGVFANNPAMCALAQALDPRLANRIAPESIRMLSLGTGYSATYFDRKKNWGLAQWALHSVDLLTDGVLGVADFQARQLLGSSNYARLTVPLGSKIAMDDPGMMNTLTQIGGKADIAPALELIDQW